MTSSFFSAHQLHNDDGSLSRVIGNCVFGIPNKEGFDYYPLLLATIDHDRLTPSSQVDDTWNRGNQDDWVIGRLARPVRGIEPYHLPERLDVGALFLEIYRRLHDPGQNRPEWPCLLLENGESMLRQHRLADAFQCFHSADAQEAGCITWPRSTQPAYETEASFSLLAGESHRMWQHWRRRSA